MDYGTNRTIDGVLQFNTAFRRREICDLLDTISVDVRVLSCSQRVLTISLLLLLNIDLNTWKIWADDKELILSPCFVLFTIFIVSFFTHPKRETQIMGRKNWPSFSAKCWARLPKVLANLPNWMAWGKPQIKFLSACRKALRAGSTPCDCIFCHLNFRLYSLEDENVILPKSNVLLQGIIQI